MRTRIAMALMNAAGTVTMLAGCGLVTLWNFVKGKVRG